MSDKILVQQENFDVAAEYALLSDNPETGAIVSFIGKVRNFNQNSDVTGLHLEHYPAMTQVSLEKLVTQAHERWPIQGCSLAINDQIVLILVASAHRKAAFAACEFLIDELKTSAPFWKKERLSDDSLRWLCHKASTAGLSSGCIKRYICQDAPSYRKLCQLLQHDLLHFSLNVFDAAHVVPAGAMHDGPAKVRGTILGGAAAAGKILGILLVHILPALIAVVTLGHKPLAHGGVYL